jgi:ABC-type microcin C transport system permease subunit YejB
MLSFILRRLVIAIPTIILISVFVFTLQKLLPGDPVLAMAGEERDPQVLEFLREKYRLNDPIPVQYFTWIGNALTGDLGISLRTNQPVLELIGEKLPVTIQLATMAMIFALLIGVPAGIFSAVKKGDPELLAGHHADPAGLGEMETAARLGLCAAERRPHPLHHRDDHARFRAGHGARGHTDAPHPVGHAERPEQ